MIIYQDKNLCLYQSLLYKTNSVVIGTEDLVLVVDPTWLPHEVKEIREYVNQIRNDRPLYLLFTHSDYDHILGYQAFPDARVIASKAFASKSEQEKAEIVEQIKAFDDEYYLERPYEISYPSVDLEAEHDGDRVKEGNTTLFFYQAPGHNADGMFTVIEPLGLLLTGDYFSDVEFPYIYHNSYEYETTLKKLDGILQRHDILMLITGHGDPADQVEEMKKRQIESMLYIDSMREAVARGDQEQIDQLIEGCRFPRNMKKFHQNNQRLFERELKEYPHQINTEYFAK